MTAIPICSGGFPQRGYDSANDPYRLLSNPVGQDSLWPATAANRFAQLTLMQVGQAVQISQMTFEGALYNTASGGITTGSIAIIFWDGVYDAANGLPYAGSGSSQTQKLAQTAHGTNGYLIRFSSTASSINFYTVEFDSTNPADSIHPALTAAQEPMLINDPQGRFGYMIAAVPDPGHGAVSNVWYYDKGAPNGLNRAFLYKNYNFTTSTTKNSSGGYTSTLKPGLAPAPGQAVGSTLLPGQVAYTNYTDADCNAGKTTQTTDPNTMQTVSSSPYLPLNPWAAFYGKKRNGAAFATGELRGRIRSQGFDPDSNASFTKVTESVSGSVLPGERRSGRYAFSFITPPLDTTQINPKTVWNSSTLPPGCTVAYRQELDAQPSYGLNNDGFALGNPLANTPVKLNYRIRGIPVGEYSLLVQQIPVYGAVTNGGITTLFRDTLTAPDTYPGSDFVCAVIPHLTIGPSLYVGPTRSPEGYTNPTVLDIKLHRPADISGSGGAPDGVIDIADFGVLVNDYGNVDTSGNELADIAGGLDGAPDGTVDIGDFGILVNEYGDSTQIAEPANYP